MTRVIPLDRLATLDPTRGLEPGAAAERRARFGPNHIVEAHGRGWVEVLRDTAGDPMIWFLAGTAAAYALLGQGREALTLLLAVVPLAGMDAWLHRRTRASLEGLRAALAAEARALRGSAEGTVPAADLVPGDLVRVGAGEPFPADGVVLAGEALQVDESLLTGESNPVRKRPLERVGPSSGGELPVPDESWVLAGTRLLAGDARVRLVWTGAETLYGQVVREAVAGTRARTPLQAAVGQLVSVLLAVAAALCLVLAFVRLRQGAGLLDAIVSAATLAVAALPEEFPVALAVFLGVGVYRLARRRALVRRAASVETIGRVTAICSDKTGTITEGRLRLAHLLPAPGLDEARLLELATLAARAETHDPVDVALLDARPTDAPAPPAALATFPFTEDRRRETAVVREGERLLAATKGAPEVILAMTTLGPPERQAWGERVAALAGEAHKVLACAWRPLADWPGGEPDRELRLAGLVALEDPIRPGVREAIARCRAAGIHVLMVTGDHPLTALTIARELGLGSGAPRAIEGEELERRLERGDPRWRELDVVARARPAHKLFLVRALQASGEHVVVTGDGVNDVPALQAADVGIAMGQRGTRSAREVAAIVLLDDDFSSIVGAIAEGRQLFRNLQLSFQYLLTIHIPLVLTATAIPLAGHELLYLPVHVVWLETLIHPTAMLVFQELPRPGALAPVRPGGPARFFTAGEWAAIAASGLALTAWILALHHRSLGVGHGDAAHARAIAMASLSAVSATLCLGLGGLRNRAALLTGALTLALAALLIQTPPLAASLHLTPLHLDDWGLALLGALAGVQLPLLALRARGSAPVPGG